MRSFICENIYVTLYNKTNKQQKYTMQIRQSRTEYAIEGTTMSETQHHHSLATATVCEHSVENNITSYRGRCETKHNMSRP